MIFRRYAIGAMLFLTACSQDGPSLADGRISPFAPGREIALRAPQAPSAAALALSPALAGQSVPKDPFVRAVQCAVAMAKLKELMSQLAEPVAARAMPALDEAQAHYREEARRIAGANGASVEQAFASAMKDPAMAGPGAARKASACLRTDTPPNFAASAPGPAPVRSATP